MKINNSKELFSYNQLFFGVSAVLGIFQRAVDYYLDDILTTGETEADTLQNLDEVLTKLSSVNIHHMKEKAIDVVYLGNKTEVAGLHPVEKKVHATTESPPS